ncbi:MAG: aspartate--tRNA(Asn) ligase [Nanoarchaeota archaeon]|nr:aspartate--tRNA(Asn) ligase [Nanoarchaeota archaeon]
MERTYADQLKTGKTYMVKGWVDKVKNLGGLKFFKLKDRTGFIQITGKKGDIPDDVFSLFDKLNKEACVAVTGKVKESKVAPGGKELIPEKMELLNQAESPLPLENTDKIQSGFDTRFDFRFIDLRQPKVQAIVKVKDAVLTKTREFFEGEGFIEVHTPVIQAAGAEGGATLFDVKYYKEKAFLRQSPQLYKQILMASGLDKVYEIGPAFRAEKFHTSRHVSEFLSLDFEIAWIDSMEDVLRIIENMCVHIVKGVASTCEKELDILGVKDLKVPKTPFERITYSDGVDILEKMGTKFKWGEDMMDAEEKIIGEYMTKKGHEWYFVTRFPAKLKPFYVMMDGKESHSYDLIFKGMEMASGGQREHRPDVLIKVMKEKGLNPDNFKFYVDAFRYGMPEHGGMGFGVERLVQKLLNLENVKETILFPRTPERLVP